MNKIEAQQRANNRKMVLDEIIKRPNGALSADIAESTGISANTVRRILIFLSAKGVVFGKKLSRSERRNSKLWFKSKPQAISEVQTQSGIPYPDLDKDHAEWCDRINSKNKPVYNPWERAND